MHIGNLRWRDLIFSQRKLYMENRQNTAGKRFVSNGIVRAIRALDPPGRFLEKDERTRLWFDIGVERARKKTSQMLREKALEEKKNKILYGPASAIASSSRALAPPSAVVPPQGNFDKMTDEEKKLALQYAQLQRTRFEAAYGHPSFYRPSWPCSPSSGPTPIAVSIAILIDARR
jgi:hypothetical protein